MADGFANALTGVRAQRWNEARHQLREFVTSVGVTQETFTTAVFLSLLPGRDEKQVVDQLRDRLPESGGIDDWAYLTVPKSEDRPARLLALPVRHPTNETVLTFPFVEVHSRLGAWWLTNAWRGVQLGEATWSLADRDALIPAAACGRALLETAAACWHDAGRLRDAWNDTKQAQSKLSRGDPLPWKKLAALLYEIQYGAKFDGRVPDLERTWQQLKRANVLGQIDKLARVTNAPVLEAYQWLCNTVHPSVGGTLVFSSPLLRHETRTHHVVGFAGVSTSLVGQGAEEAERTIHNAIADGAVTAVSVLTETLDAALKVVDDVCLTADIQRISDFDTWRKLRRPARNDLCPCRSGRKAKACSHRWNDAAPAVPKGFGR